MSDTKTCQLRSSVDTYIIYLYCALFLQKGLSAITNYCHLSRKKEHEIQKTNKQTNKHELNVMRKKIYFEKFFENSE